MKLISSASEAYFIFKRSLFHRDVEATLVHLILDITTIPLTEIAQHLAEHPLQGIVLHLSARLLASLNLLISVVAHIKGGAIEMARVLGGIAIASAELRHIVLCAEDARHDNLVQRDALDLQRVEISTPDVRLT